MATSIVRLGIERKRDEPSRAVAEGLTHWARSPRLAPQGETWDASKEKSLS